MYATVHVYTGQVTFTDTSYTQPCLTGTPVYKSIIQCVDFSFQRTILILCLAEMGLDQMSDIW